MIIKSLTLSGFRNYDSLAMEFGEGTNILYGDNAQGKTNILEALYVCGTTKSHKGSRDREMIELGRDESHIRLLLERDGASRRIDMHLKKNKPKGVAIDGIPIKRSSELFGIINMVFFSPEDLGIIKDGPGERRRFIDLELCQLDKVYLHNLVSYNKVLNQRNNLLKQIGFNRELMDTIQVWDDQLEQYGKCIIKTRREFISELSGMIVSIHKELSGGTEELAIRYEPNVTEEEFKDKLKKTLDRDLALRMTNLGPHRDDMSFSISSGDIRRYGSQGQQRTAALALKLAEIQLVKKRIRDNPVLLLDDVLSELDRRRQNLLLHSIHDIQTIVTCTGLEEFVNNRVKYDRIYQVVNGTVIKKN